MVTTTPSVQRRTPLRARVGLIAVGHRIYWSQFDGLLAEMDRKRLALRDRLGVGGVEVIDFGLIDDAESAYAAVPRIKAADIDLLFVDMVTYATSATFGALCREVALPIVLVALQPLDAMDYARGTTFMQLCNDDFCSVPEFAGVAIRFGRRPPPCILGYEQGDAAASAEIARWRRIACALHDLKRARFGLMGHVLEAMLDMHSDPTAITAAFGAHIALVEPDELLAQYEAVSQSQIDDKKEEILGFFDTPDPGSDPVARKLSEPDLANAARAAAALDGLIAARSLDGLAYYYEGRPDSSLREVVTNLIVGNSLLTSAGFPMCGEFDIKTCVAMMIMDRLDIGGSFAEFHPIDFRHDSVLVGHDGPHHINIADSRPVLRSLDRYHGKPGSGACVEFQIRQGPMTMLSIGVKADGKFKFVVAEGESVRRPIPPTGNTNTHGVFKPDVRTFLTRWVAEGPTHHFALGIGHHAKDIEQIARAINVDFAVVA